MPSFGSQQTMPLSRKTSEIVQQQDLLQEVIEEEEEGDSDSDSNEEGPNPLSKEVRKEVHDFVKVSCNSAAVGYFHCPYESADRDNEDRNYISTLQMLVNIIRQY